MFCDPTSRPASPFHHGPTHPHTALFPHAHAHLRPTYSTSFSNPSFHSTSTQPCAAQSTPVAIPTSISTPTTPSFNNTSNSRSIHSRPKALKKPSASTSTKQRNVQLSLEVKVEKAKGFHNFFVPLCKNMPPAPPCSPVLSHAQLDDRDKSAKGEMEMDYFGQWNTGTGKQRDQWVENVGSVKHNGEGHVEGMEVDIA